MPWARARSDAQEDDHDAVVGLGGGPRPAAGDETPRRDLSIAVVGLSVSAVLAATYVLLVLPLIVAARLGLGSGMMSGEHMGT